MEKRKRIKEETKEQRMNAPVKRREDREYQAAVLQRWAMMNGHSKEVAMVSDEVATA